MRAQVNPQTLLLMDNPLQATLVDRQSRAPAQVAFIGSCLCPTCDIEKHMLDVSWQELAEGRCPSDPLVVIELSAMRADTLSERKFRNSLLCKETFNPTTGKGQMVLGVRNDGSEICVCNLAMSPDIFAQYLPAIERIPAHLLH